MVKVIQMKGSRLIYIYIEIYTILPLIVPVCMCLCVSGSSSNPPKRRIWKENCGGYFYFFLAELGGWYRKGDVGTAYNSYSVSQLRFFFFFFFFFSQRKQK